MLIWDARSQIICRSCKIPRLPVPQACGIRNRSLASPWRTPRARVGLTRQDPSDHVTVKQLRKHERDQNFERSPQVVSSSHIGLGTGDQPKGEQTATDESAQLRVQNVKKGLALTPWRVIGEKEGWTRNLEPGVVPGLKAKSQSSLKKHRVIEDEKEENKDDNFAKTWSAKLATLGITRTDRGIWRYTKNAVRHLSDDNIVTEWLKIPKNVRIGVWVAFTRQALKFRHLQGLRLLATTMLPSDTDLPKYIIYDCLYHLTRHFLANVEYPSRRRVKNIQDLICQLARDCTEETPFRNRNNMVYWILKHSTNEQTRQVFDALNHGSISLHGYTWLHFLTRLVDQGNIAASLQCLDRVVASGLDLQNPAVMSCCVRLLRARTSTKAWYQVQSDILTRLLELGVRPNLPMWNVMLYNAIKAGDHSTAWSMYEIGRQNNLEPNDVTYRTLLILARDSLEKDTLHRIVDHAENQGLVPNDQGVVFHILYTAFVVESKRKAFDLMLRIYSRYFDQRPLDDLGIGLSGGTRLEKSPQGQQHLSIFGQDTYAGIERQEGLRREFLVIFPNPTIIGMMIIGYLRQNSKSPHLMDFYNRYHSLVMAGHPTISHVPRVPHVGNAFMHAFKYRKATFRFLTTIFAHMQESRPFQSREHSVVKDYNETAGQPDIKSWNILINAALLQNQRPAIKIIEEQMKKYGVSRNVVTWNTIIGGYAEMQDEDATLEAVKQMRAENLEADEITVKALGKLHDRAAVLKALRLWEDDCHEPPPQLEVERQEKSSQDSALSEDDNGESVHKRTLHSSYAERRRSRFDDE